MSSLRSDTIYAMRSLARTPSFTVAVTLTLALGIGVGTTVFTAFEALVLRPLPYPAADRLVAITYHLPDPERLSGTSAPVPAVIRWRDGAREFDALSWYAVHEQALRTSYSDQLRVPVAAVSSGFFPTLGVPAAALGRGLQPEDARPGARAVAVLSHRFWQTHFSGADVLGRSLWINRQEHEIVGITDSRLTFPDHPEPDVLVPMTELYPGEPVVRFVKVIGRPREGASPVTAQADLVNLTKITGEDYPAEMFAFLAAGGMPRVTMLRSHASRAARPILPAMLVGSAVLLLLVCANVSGLLLARLFSRQRELAIRAALGAPLLAQARSVWLEVGLLAVLATTASLLAVWWAHGLLRALLSSVTPYASDMTMSVPVVIFGFGIAALTTGICAAWPTVRIARGEAGAHNRMAHGRSGGAHVRRSPSDGRDGAAYRRSRRTGGIRVRRAFDGRACERPDRPAAAPRDGRRRDGDPGPGARGSGLVRAAGLHGRTRDARVQRAAGSRRGRCRHRPAHCRARRAVCTGGAARRRAGGVFLCARHRGFPLRRRAERSVHLRAGRRVDRARDAAGRVRPGLARRAGRSSRAPEGRVRAALSRPAHVGAPRLRALLVSWNSDTWHTSRCTAPDGHGASSEVGARPRDGWVAVRWQMALDRR
jgi:hypothetical protein